MSGESRDTVQQFVDKHGAKYPILYEAQSGAYSSGGVPHAYLIGSDGKIAWAGHPAGLQHDEIEAQLKKVEKAHRVSTWAFVLQKQMPAVPSAMSGVDKLLEKMQFGAALKKVEAALPKLEGDDKTAGEALREFIAHSGTRGIEKAAEMAREGQPYQAFLQYEQVEERYKGHDLAKQAKDAAKALESDKAAGLEIDAGEKLAGIKKEMASENSADGKLKLLKPLLSKKYAETAAGKEAAKLAADVEKK